MNKKEKDRLLYFKVGISILAFLLFVSHSIWKTFIDDYYSLILLFFVILPWLDIILKKIKLFGFSADFKDEVDDSSEFVDKITAQKDDKIVEFQKSTEIILIKKSNNDFLSLKARINYPKEAGTHFLMKVSVNNTVLTSSFIVNKPDERVINAGRIGKWFNSSSQAWAIPYSPDFKTNYLNSYYKVTNGDAYLFIFDLKSIVPINDQYVIQIYHLGTFEKDSFKNSIIINDIEIL